MNIKKNKRKEAKIRKRVLRVKGWRESNKLNKNVKQFQSSKSKEDTEDSAAEQMIQDTLDRY